MTKVAKNAPTGAMKDRVERLLELVNEGFTVLAAGRKMGLERRVTQDTARRFNIKCLPGPLGEARYEAGRLGNIAMGRNVSE